MTAHVFARRCFSENFQSGATLGRIDSKCIHTEGVGERTTLNMAFISLESTLIVGVFYSEKNLYNIYRLIFGDDPTFIT